jgi:hypothetical protein
VLVRLMYVAYSMWHSLYLQRFTQSWADKRCMHSVSILSATRFASISVDMCARISCKRVHCSAPQDLCVDVCHSSFWLSMYFVSLALMIRGKSHNLQPLAPRESHGWWSQPSTQTYPHKPSKGPVGTYGPVPGHCHDTHSILNPFKRADSTL